MTPEEVVRGLDDLQRGPEIQGLLIAMGPAAVEALTRFLLGPPSLHAQPRMRLSRRRVHPAARGGCAPSVPRGGGRGADSRTRTPGAERGRRGALEHRETGRVRTAPWRDRRSPGPARAPRVPGGGGGRDSRRSRTGAREIGRRGGAGDPAGTGRRSVLRRPTGSSGACCLRPGRRSKRFGSSSVSGSSIRTAPKGVRPMSTS